MSASGVARPPIHCVLDVVGLASSDRLLALGLAGHRGAVLAIRRYLDGRYRYSVGSLLDPARTRTSVHVTPNGDVVGQASYVVVDDIEQYL